MHASRKRHRCEEQRQEEEDAKEENGAGWMAEKGGKTSHGDALILRNDPNNVSLSNNYNLDVPESEETDEIDPSMLPCDTLAALWLLRREFPQKLLSQMMPFMLKTQLYTIVDDKTRVDKELDILRKTNKVRMFQIPSHPEDIALQLVEDFVASIQSYKNRASPSLQEYTPGLDWFCDHVLPQCTQNRITHGELLHLMERGRVRSSQTKKSAGGLNSKPVTDEHITVLLQSCCLVRDTKNMDVLSPHGINQCYWFALPNAGSAFRVMYAGKNELLRIFSRRKNPEMLEAQLLQKKLKSDFGVAWHLRDLLGEGRLIRIENPSGPSLRLVKDE